MRAKILIWMIAMFIFVPIVFGALNDTEIYYSHDAGHFNGTWTLDESGNNRNAVLGGNPTNLTGIINNSLLMDGADDDFIYTNADVSTILAENFSISLWVDYDSWDDLDWLFHTKYLVGGNYYGVGVRHFPGTHAACDVADCLGFYTLDGDTNAAEDDEKTVYGLANITSAGWHHIVITFDDTANSKKLYYNGVEITDIDDGDGTYTGAVAFSGTDCIAFGGYTNDCATLTSDIEAGFDEIAVYSRTLSSTEVTQLYDSHTGYNPYSAGGGTTDVDFTITDQWNGSSINTFNVNVSWSNGTTTEHTTTNGTVSLINITSGAINVTYWNMTNYFNRTISDTLTENVSNTVTTNTYQAVLCLNASAKVSEAWVTADNFTIETNTTSSCFNITAGSHNVQAQKSGWFPKNQTLTVTALSNATQTIQNLSYANLTIYARDGNTNTSLSGYNLTILSLNHSGWTGETASAVTNHSAYLINGTYNVTISMPGYAVTYSQANITVNGATNYTFTLYLSNSVSITIRDEITNDIITENVTVRWSDNITTWENVTNTGTLFVSNITAGNYTLLFYSTNYSTRTYSLTVGPSSHQFLTAYMISSTYSTIFTIKDIDTGSILDGVTITMYKLINSTWTTVESKVSDISGKAQFYYDPIANYRFYLAKSEYEDYVFYLNPILFSTYDVYMTKTSVLNYSVDFDDISFIYSPTSFNNNENTTLNFLISSPGGQLTNYGISVTYPGGTDADAGVNAIGEQLSVDVNITNATAYDYVLLEFNYTTSLAGSRSYNFTLPINMNVTGGTWLTLKDKTYGLGIFERMLIATIIIIFIVGIATMVGQALPGVALGLFVYGFLVFIGFVPLWAILPSMLVGVLFLIWKSGGY